MINKKLIILIIILFFQKNYTYDVGTFTKLLEHDPKTGLLTQEGEDNYNKLLKALETGDQEDFNAIKRTKGIKRLWLGPQTAYAKLMPGLDLKSFTLAPPPAFSSPQAAADLIELYWMVLCRDVKFADYGTSKEISLASRMLTNLGSAYQGPKKGNVVDNSVIFRGNTAGDLNGPFISQLLLLPIIPLYPGGETDVGASNISLDLCTKYRLIPIMNKREFGIRWDDFIALQNGFIPKKFVRTDFDAHAMRYPICGRDLGCIVYTDESYDMYYYAVNILAGYNFPFSKAFPYDKGICTNEAAEHTMGLSDLYSSIASVTAQALKVCWYFKWRVYRRLRPEAMAGFVHQARITDTNPFNLYTSLFNACKDIDLLQMIFEHNHKESYLLAQMYPEASPTHPSYPAAHATIAGACTTIMKAFFDDTALIKSKVMPVIVDPNDPTKLKPYKSRYAQRMTVGAELDKLASNIAYARSWAGIHFRSDNEAGLKLGEDIAIRFLQLHALTYHEKDFNGFELTKRDGKRIRITPDAVIIIK